MSRVLLHKDKTGQKWFVGVYSNNFKDREKEFLSWESHLEYAKWVKDTGVKLPVTVMHQPKFPVLVHLAQLMALNTGKITAKEFSDNYMELYKPFAFAQTEAIIPIKGFTLVIAKILKNKEHVAESLNEARWAMSHGFLALDRTEDTLNQYRSFEFTVLPPEMAANIITVSSIKEIFEMDALKGMSEEDQATLADLLKSDPAELETAFGKMQEILGSVIDSKEITEDETEPENTYEELRVKLFSDLNVEELQKAFAQFAKDIQAISSRLDEYEERIKQTERSEDEKIAARLVVPAWDYKSEDTEDISDDDAEELRENAVGEKKLEGIEEIQKMQTADPIAWTTQVLVAGAQ